MLGVVEEFIRLIFLDDLPFIHEQDAMRHAFGESHLMGHDQHGHSKGHVKKKR